MKNSKDALEESDVGNSANRRERLQLEHQIEAFEIRNPDSYDRGEYRKLVITQLGRHQKQGDPHESKIR